MKIDWQDLFEGLALDTACALGFVMLVLAYIYFWEYRREQ